MICQICKTALEDDKWLLALDRPLYLNLWVHKRCWRDLDVVKFVQENYEELKRKKA